MFAHRVINREDCETSKWSGGETRQIYIYPEDSSYANRTFDYRVSSATVDLDESDFTLLSGYNRYIMTLSGSIHLIHEGQHEIKLNPFTVDYFSGSWKTKCYGRCVDFNLMLKEGYKGSIEPLKNLCSMNMELSKQVGIFSLYDNVDVYTIEGEFEVLVGRLQKGDMLLIEEGQERTEIIALVDDDVPQGEIVAVSVTAYREE